MQVSVHPATTILQQLGGDKFVAMTGAKDFMSADNPQPRLIFRLPAATTKNRGTHMEISLMPTDEYQMVFYKAKRGSPTERQIISVNRGVQVSNLRDCFESMTGLYTSLGSAFDSRDMLGVCAG